MTEHEPPAVELDLGIVLHARPTHGATRHWSVIVAHDEVFLAMESGQEFRYPPRPGPDGEVAEVPDRVTRADHTVPGFDQGLIHGRHGGEWASEEIERASVAEVSVSGEERGQDPGPARVPSYRCQVV
jgi:hypothetical protein